MVRKSTIVLAASILIALIGGQAWAQSGGKAMALAQFAQAPKGQLPSRTSAFAAASPKEAQELELDLIFYRWACHISGVQADVKNIDAIVSALAKDLNDQTINWAVAYFTTNKDGSSLGFPDRDGDRVPALSELFKQFKSAESDKETSSVDALEALKRARELCHNLSLELSEGLVQKQLGDLNLYKMALYREAKSYYDLACWTFTSYGCIASKATVYDDLGTLSTQSGGSEAVENYINAAQQWDMLAKADPSGWKYRDLVGREYMRAGSAAQAGNFNSAHELMTAHGLVQLRMWAHPNKSYDALIRNLIEVARLDRDHALRSEALELLDEAKTACKVQGDPLLSARVYDEYSKTFANPTQRVEAARQRDIILEESARVGEAAITKIDNIKTPATLRSGLYKKVEWGAKSYEELKNYARSAAIWKKMADVYGKAGMPDKQIQAMRNEAAMLDIQGKTQESLAVRGLAATIATSANKESTATEIAHEIVQASVEANDLPNALEAFTEWGNLVDQSHNTRAVAGVFEERAELLSKHQLNQEAIADYEKARTRYLQVSDPWAAGAISIKLADAQRTVSKPEDSLATLETALDDIENRYGQDNPRADPGTERARVLIGIYHDLISLYVTGGAADKADALVSKAKQQYRWVADLVNQLKTSPDRAVAAYANKLVMIDVAPPPQQVSHESVVTLGDDVFGFWSACTTLEASHLSNYRALPIDPKALLKARLSIPRDTLVVEYMTTETGTEIFVCGFDKTICVEASNTRDAVGQNVTQLRRVLKTCEGSLGAGIPLPQITDWQDSSFLQIKEPLRGLYDQLIGPIAKNLDRARIMFVLPGELAGMPMHALISSGTNKTPRFLIQDYEVGYLGKWMLDDLVNKDNRIIDCTEDRLAMFADPEGNLPGTYSEAKNIIGVYPDTQSFIGPSRATATNFLRECATANIVHVAAHHIIDPTPGGFSLMLARDDKSDGRVGMRELIKIRNPALRLVVLSACDAIGSSDPISMGPAMAAEAFSMIGAKSVLGGLWKVSDEVASSIMGDFYRNLAHGAQSRTQALRGAQLNAIKDRQFGHPFYWACFALYGSPK